MAEILRAEGLGKRFEKAGNVVNALSDMDLVIEAGEFLAIQGPSGSGKSTMLNLLGCLDRPTSGRLFIGGADVSRMGENELAELRAKKIGFIFQAFNLISVLSAQENVELPMMATGVPRAERASRAAVLLERVGLAGRVKHRPDELSAGEQQRVAIARALANSPSLILADEPTGNLDTGTGKEIMGILQILNREFGTTIIMVTHDDCMAKMANMRLLMKDGRIERIDSPEVVPGVLSVVKEALG